MTETTEGYEAVVMDMTGGEWVVILKPTQPAVLSFLLS
jgi:hypothetical protein